MANVTYNSLLESTLGINEASTEERVKGYLNKCTDAIRKIDSKDNTTRQYFQKVYMQILRATRSDKDLETLKNDDYFSDEEIERRIKYAEENGLEHGYAGLIKHSLLLAKQTAVSG